MIILDLDGCISDDRWRRHLIEPRDNEVVKKKRLFDDYHQLSAFDKLCNTHLLHLLLGQEAIIFTGRTVKFRAITQEWLRRNSVPVKHLLMRNNDDHRPSPELKRTFLEWLGMLYEVPRNQIVCAYDDREDVVAMYKEFGLPAFCVSINENGPVIL